MAQKTVQFIIGQILTDEELRMNFLEQPTKTLAALKEKGFDLTEMEIEAIAQTDRRLWRIGAEWLDPRIQRCRLGS